MNCLGCRALVPLYVETAPLVSGWHFIYTKNNIGARVELRCIHSSADSDPECVKQEA